MRRKPEAGGDYNVALIDLDEGPRMMAHVEGIEPDTVKIGQKVQVGIRQSGDQNIVIFTPAGA